MNTELPQQSGQSIGEQLALFITSRREEIHADWMAAVTRDSKIHSSDNLTLKQLKNHLPQLLDNLSDTLKNAFSQSRKEEAANTASQHGEHRWSEGYDLSELLREFSHIRTAVVPHIIIFEEEHPDFGFASKSFAQVTIHRFFDNAVRNSVEGFLEEQHLQEIKQSP